MQPDASRYRRVRLLGRGSFGEVFEAEDTLLDRHVAIKVLPFADRIPVLARRALLREAQMAAAAGRSAVQVFDFVKVGAESWLVMEYVGNGSLTDWAHSERTASELATIVGSLVDRVAIMHDLGLVHGDIHPRNLLVRADDDVALSDFGLARVTAEAVKSTGAHERHWSAPEVLEAGVVSPAADVYSLALVLQWVYREAGCQPPKPIVDGLIEDPRARPPDGRAFALLFEHAASSGAVKPAPDERLEAKLRFAADAARAGKTGDATRILENAIRHAPLDPRPRKRLGLLRWMSGERQAALWALEGARRLDPADRLTAKVLLNWREAMEDE